jgi:uridine kinase
VEQCDLEHIKQHIVAQHKKHHVKRPFIIAIDGLGGAGKTTFVNELKNRLKNILVIHIDDHIVERSKRYDTGHEQWYEYYQLQWDTVYLEEQLYKRIHQNDEHLYLPFYNKNQDTCTNKTIHLSPDHIVLIEGVFLLREEWKHYYDFIIFLDCPKEIRYERVLERDTYIGNVTERLKKYQERYWIAEDYYLTKQSPLKLAHSVIKS